MNDGVPLFPRPGTDARGFPRGAARAPGRLRDRALAQFRTPENRKYLEAYLSRALPAGRMRALVLRALPEAIETFSNGEGYAHILLDSDNLAARDAARPAAGLWGEVQRLNRAFAQDRLSFAQSFRRLAEGTAERGALAGRAADGAPTDGAKVPYEDEPFHMQMFTADSLRPPGLEHLNAPGPLYELLEDQARVARFAQPRIGDPEAGDEAWDDGEAHRTPEQALVEYYGDSAGVTVLGRADRWPRYQAPDTVADRGFMRYRGIPFWQTTGTRSGVDHDIAETLGHSTLELGNLPGRWDLSRMRAPHGQEYRTYGWRDQ